MAVEVRNEAAFLHISHANNSVCKRSCSRVYGQFYIYSVLSVKKFMMVMRLLKNLFPAEKAD